jgi:hypothetical protein
MKRETALKALDNALDDEMGLLIRVMAGNITARDPQALDKFGNGFGSLVKAYDGAAKIITDKLVE